MGDHTFLQYAVVASGASFSTVMEIDRARASGMWTPNSETSQVFLQVSWDTTAGNFARAQLSAGGGDWSVASNTTAVAARLGDIAAPFQYARVQLGAAATDPRTFVFSAKI